MLRDVMDYYGVHRDFRHAGDCATEAQQQLSTALKTAMKLATRNEERQKVLEGIGFARVLDTLHYVLPYLDDKDLVKTAKRMNQNREISITQICKTLKISRSTFYRYLALSDSHSA